jgi:hypothetical protein
VPCLADPEVAHRPGPGRNRVDRGPAFVRAVRFTWVDGELLRL